MIDPVWIFAPLMFAAAILMQWIKRVAGPHPHANAYSLAYAGMGLILIAMSCQK